MRFRGFFVVSFVVSELRSRSSLFNFIDSGFGFLFFGFQVVFELGKGNQFFLQRFNVISLEDFDQEFVVKFIKVKRKKKKKKIEGGSRSICYSFLEFIFCFEFFGDSFQFLNIDLLLMILSVLGSSMDQLSVEFLDLESGFSGEVNGGLWENIDFEMFNVLEVLGFVFDFLVEENDIRIEMLYCYYVYGQELFNGVREDVRGSDVMGFEDEFCFVDDGLYSIQIFF